MRKDTLEKEVFYDFKNPGGIIGVAGIYDIRLVRGCHENPSYTEFTISVFGSDESLWDAVSPSKLDRYKEAWPKARTLALASSEGNALVDDKQIEVMVDRSRDLDTRANVTVIKDLKEGHNDIWANGMELVCVISSVLREHV